MNFKYNIPKELTSNILDQIVSLSIKDSLVGSNLSMFLDFISTIRHLKNLIFINFYKIINNFCFDCNDYVPADIAEHHYQLQFVYIVPCEVLNKSIKSHLIKFIMWQRVILIECTELLKELRSSIQSTKLNTNINLFFW